MTTMYATTTAPAIAAPVSDPVATRAEALHALDGAVRRLIARELTPSIPTFFFPPRIELTVYDMVYPATPRVGGHWTVAVRRPLMVGHQVSQYDITLEFDETQRPARFLVSGMTDEVSEDATLEALDAALARAAAAGARTAWAPSWVPGFSL